VRKSHKALQPCAQRLSKLIPRLGTDHDGEMVATVGAIRRTLESIKADLHDVAAVVAACEDERPATRSPPPPSDVPDIVTQANWVGIVNWIKGKPGLLSEWEFGFVSSLERWNGRLTVKQLARLQVLHTKILTRTRGRAAA
jgi:hypothetical protein